MGFSFGKRSIARLTGLHHDLALIAFHSIRQTKIDFTITCGLRSADEQRLLFEAGRSKTLNSRHLTGHAFDFAPWVDGGIDWENHDDFRTVAETMKAVAEDLRIKIQWGGDFKGGWDKPHIQLPWIGYPKNGKFERWKMPDCPEPAPPIAPPSKAPRIPGKPPRMTKRRRPGQREAQL